MKKFTHLFGRLCSYGVTALALAAVNPCAHAQNVTVFVERGPIVVDIMGKLEWMRCSVGQIWVDDRCDGDPLLAPFSAGEKIIARTAASSGDGWRIPTRAELERLVVQSAIPPLIDGRMFPNTHRGGYWTADANWMLAGSHWIVNFNSGFSYGRALQRQAFAFRLVRSR